MKKTLLIALVLFVSTTVFAMPPMTLTGFNTDVVANGIGAANVSTTHDVDSGGYALMAPDFQQTSTSTLPSFYLPASGLITSGSTGLVYQLGSYSGLNNLRLQTTNAGTLTFGTPTAASVVYILGFSGSGSSTATITVKFSDNTTQVFTGVSFQDWYGGSGFAIGNVGRVIRSTGVLETTATNGPRLYEVPLALSPSNYAKQIVSVTVQRTGGSAANSILNVMGITTSTATFAGGNYTINNTQPTAGTNFASFTEAVNAMVAGGVITGPVTFTVVPGTGPYTEQVAIPAIAGTSSTNRITFNCNGATLTKSISDANTRYGILFNGADFITFDSLIVDLSAGTYGWGFTYTNGADSNIVRKCTINLSQTSTTTANFIGFVASGSITSPTTSGSNANGNQILNNTINGGGYGIQFYGSSTAASYNKRNTFIGNVVKDFYSYGIYVYGNDSLTISKSDLSRPTRSTLTTTYCIYPSTCTNVLVEKNRIHNLFDAATSNTSSVYYYYVASSGLSATAPNKYENNVIYNLNGGGTLYGFYGLGYNYVNYYHNTVLFDHAAAASTSTTYGMYVYGTGVNVKNNIVYINRGGTGSKYCLYYSTTGVASSNNNVLYNASTSGTSYIGYQSANYATMSAWQAYNGGVYDGLSYNLDPLITNASTGDLTPSNPSINDVGAAGLGVLKDLNDVTRSANPDPGAVEFQLPPCTNPPSAGTTVVSVTNACPGQTFTLSLNGNSIGSGLVFQWQTSATASGTYTNLGSSSTNPIVSVSQLTSLYYRCAVTCGTGATVYSNPVQVTSPALVSGTNWTINNTQPTAGNNFNNFTDAMNYIKCGISGPVTFTVAPGSGPYNDSIRIPQVYGASRTNKILIKGNGTTLTYSCTDVNYRSAVLLNGADFVTIDSLIIDMSANTSTAGWGVLLTNQADSNTITKCTIINNATATTSNFCGILINGSTTSAATSGNNGNGNTISYNTITGGYYGILCYGNSGGYNNKSNSYIGNNIKEFYYMGMYILYSDSVLISKNDISRPTRTTTTSIYGIYNSCTNMTIEKNTIHNLFDAITTSSSSAYGIYCFGTGVSAASPNRVENNLLYNFNNGAGLQYGIYGSGYNYYNYYHNTVVLDHAASTAGTTYALYVSGTGVNVSNNIAIIARGGTGTKYTLYATSGLNVCNNNNFINASTSGTNAVVNFSAVYTTLAAWQSAQTTYDQQSVSIDPVFANPSGGDFKPTTSLVNDLGAPVGIVKDILDSTRSTTKPDIGAYEFSTITAGLNFGTDALVTPANVTTGCYSGAESVSVRIRNSGAATHNFATNPVTVTVNVTGAITQTLIKTINIGTLQSDSTLIVTMNTTINMSTAGTYTFNANTTLSGDVNSSNDAILPVTRTKNALTSGTATSTTTSYCALGGVLPTLTISNFTGQSSIQWQESTTSGTGFTNISGANTSTYTPASISQNKYFRAIVGCASNTSNSNEIAITYNNPSIISTTPATRCGTGTVSLSATPSSGAVINWYAANSGGTVLSTGNTYTTPSLTATTTYYAAASSGTSNIPVPGGNTWNQYTTVGSFQTTAIGSASMVFDALVPVVISSVDIYPSAAVGTSFTIEVRSTSATGTLIASYTGTTTVTNSGTPSVAQTVPVNFTIPAGTNYVIGFSSNPNTWRGNITNFPYPYLLPGYLNIQGSSFGTSPGTSLIYQYYFYNWVVSVGCESARTAVTATINTTLGCGSVPVSIMNFKGEKLSDGANKLSWSTSSEVNNAGFYIERSTDGINFSDIQFVQTKALNGNSNTLIQYDFMDTRGAIGNNFYRLKQIDKDGKSNYSSIVLLKGSKVGALTISALYPNPVVNTLNIVLTSPSLDMAEIVIIDGSGRIVKSQKQTVIQGDSRINIDVKQLPQGTYIVKAICSSGCETAKMKFIK